MSEAVIPILDVVEAAVAPAAPRLLSEAAPGDRGVIVRVHPSDDARGALTSVELERRLLELGFVEGATVEVLHQGLFGRDPMALKLDDAMRVALRRREASAVEVRFE